jgi:hypothetical protein
LREAGSFSTKDTKEFGLGSREGMYTWCQEIDVGTGGGLEGWVLGQRSMGWWMDVMDWMDAMDVTSGCDAVSRLKIAWMDTDGAHNIVWGMQEIASLRGAAKRRDDVSLLTVDSLRTASPTWQGKRDVGWYWVWQTGMSAPLGLGREACGEVARQGRRARSAEYKVPSTKHGVRSAALCRGGRGRCGAFTPRVLRSWRACKKYCVS